MKKKIDKIKFIDLISKELEIKKKDLTKCKNLNESNFWDSLSKMNFIAFCKIKFKKNINIPHLLRCRNIDELFKLVSK